MRPNFVSVRLLRLIFKRLQALDGVHVEHDRRIDALTQRLGEVEGKGLTSLSETDGLMYDRLDAMATKIDALERAAAENPDPGQTLEALQRLRALSARLEKQQSRISEITERDAVVEATRQRVVELETTTEDALATSIAALEVRVLERLKAFEARAEQGSADLAARVIDIEAATRESIRTSIAGVDQRSTERIRTFETRIDQQLGSFAERQIAALAERDAVIQSTKQRVVELESRWRDALQSAIGELEARVLERTAATESRAAHVEALMIDLVKGRGDRGENGRADLGSRLGALEEKFTMLDSMRTLLGDIEAQANLEGMAARLERMEAQISTLFTLQRSEPPTEAIVVRVDD